MSPNAAATIANLDQDARPLFGAVCELCSGVPALRERVAAISRQVAAQRAAVDANAIAAVAIAATIGLAA
jgi:hypothetical protein